MPDVEQSTASSTSPLKQDFSIDFHSGSLQFYADYPVHYLNPTFTLKQYEAFLKNLVTQTSGASEILINLKWNIKLWTLLSLILVLTFLIGVIIQLCCLTQLTWHGLVLFTLLNLVLLVAGLSLFFVGVAGLSRSYGEGFRKYRNFVILYCERWNDQLLKSFSPPNSTFFKNTDDATAKGIQFYLVDPVTKELASFIYIESIDKPKEDALRLRESSSMPKLQDTVVLDMTTLAISQVQPTDQVEIDLQMHPLPSETVPSLDSDVGSTEFNTIESHGSESQLGIAKSPSLLNYLTVDWRTNILKNYPKVILENSWELSNYIRRHPNYYNVSIQVKKESISSPHSSHLTDVPID